MLRWLKFPNLSLCAAPRTYGNNSPWHWFNYYYFKFYWTRKVFSGQESLAKDRRIFLPTQGFLVFSIKTNFGRWTISTGLFSDLFSAEQSPPRCWVLIISHFKSSWWKGYLSCGEIGVLQYEFIFPTCYPCWDKAFLQGGQIQVFFFFWEHNPRCSSVRTWRWVVSTTASGLGQWMTVVRSSSSLMLGTHPPTCSTVTVATISCCSGRVSPRYVFH